MEWDLFQFADLVSNSSLLTKNKMNPFHNQRWVYIYSPAVALSSLYITKESGLSVKSVSA